MTLEITTDTLAVDILSSISIAPWASHVRGRKPSTGRLTHRETQQADDQLQSGKGVKHGLDSSRDKPVVRLEGHAEGKQVLKQE